MPGVKHWNWKHYGAKLLLLILILLINPNGEVYSNKVSKSRQKVVPLPGQNTTESSVTGLVQIGNGGMRLKREIPEAMLDPYSVLGVLSFGVYIFYILYTRYRMRGHHTPPTQQQPQQQQQGPTLFSIDAQENFANILKMATKIISSAPYLGLSNSTMDGDDYFDVADASDLRSRHKFYRR